MILAQPKLGRRFSEDPRDEAYRIRNFVAPTPKRPHRYRWRPRHLQRFQGQTGTCVGHAYYHLLLHGPVTHAAADHPRLPDPFTIYREAVLLDPWRENDREATAEVSSALQFGTDMRSGAQVLRKRGLISNFYNGRTVAEAERVLLADAEEGGNTLAFGCNWYWSMFELNKHGFLEIAPNSKIAGGHAVLLDGINVRQGWVRGYGSWEDMPVFKMEMETLERLLGEDGDLQIVTENRLPPL